MKIEKERLIANNMANKLCDDDFLGKEYHINSKLTIKLTEESIVRATSLVMDKKFSFATKSPEKVYPGKERFQLLDAKLDTSLKTALDKRRSHGNLVGINKINMQDLSSLTWAGYGVNDDDKFLNRRTIPSAGALYPCELYMLSIDTDLGPGLFHYCPKENVYEKLKGEEVKLEELFVSKIGLENAAAVFIVTAIFDRSYFKYGERSYRFLMLEAGAIAQNISLAASSIGRIATSHGGTADVELEKYIGIDGISESVVIAVGVA